MVAFHLERFQQAQEPIIDQVRVELRQGRKTSHWMWFIFPQLRGLGSSLTAVKYAIKSEDEARAYLAHKILGPRLIECTQLVTDITGSSVDRIFGYPDNLKFHSSVTLFAAVAPDEQVFRLALKKYFLGEGDAATSNLLKTGRR